jgi:beta-glucosidase
MTLEQKIAQLHGAMETIDIYALSAQSAQSGEDMDELAAQIRVERHVRAIDELGIPRFRITNGPVGVGMGDGTPSPPATSLPMTIGLAAGFDPELAHAYGDIIGSETATLGQHVLEGPGVCLHRTTLAGRNFEYFSEDPYLSGVMGVAVTKAIQAHDVIAMAKHFVVNDQEYERFRASVEVDEHVLRELYLLPFEMLVKDADIAAVMSSYNRVRGSTPPSTVTRSPTSCARNGALTATSSPTSGRAAPAARRSMPEWTTRCRTASGLAKRTSRRLSRTPASRSRLSTAP